MIFYETMIKSEYLMPWLMTLLFDFYTPTSIFIDKCISYEKVGDRKVKILIDDEKKSLGIKITRELNSILASMLAEAVKETISECLVLGSILRNEKTEMRINEWHETKAKAPC